MDLGRFIVERSATAESCREEAHANLGGRQRGGTGRPTFDEQCREGLLTYATDVAHNRRVPIHTGSTSSALQRGGLVIPLELTCFRWMSTLVRSRQSVKSAKLGSPAWWLMLHRLHLARSLCPTSRAPLIDCPRFSFSIDSLPAMLGDAGCIKTVLRRCLPDKRRCCASGEKKRWEDIIVLEARALLRAVRRVCCSN